MNTLPDSALHHELRTWQAYVANLHARLFGDCYPVAPEEWLLLREHLGRAEERVRRIQGEIERRRGILR